MKSGIGNLKAAWHEDRRGWKTFIILVVLICFVLLAQTSHAWPNAANIKGAVSNGNLAVFSGGSSISDSGISVTAVNDWLNLQSKTFSVFEVASASARINPASYTNAYNGMCVVQTDEYVNGYPTVMYVLSGTNVAENASWLSFPMLNPETGVLPLDMRLADFTGVVPPSNAVGQVNGELRVGDGFSEGGVHRGPNGEIVINFPEQAQRKGILETTKVRQHIDFSFQCVEATSTWNYVFAFGMSDSGTDVFQFNSEFYSATNASGMAVILQQGISSSLTSFSVPSDSVLCFIDPDDDTVVHLKVGGALAQREIVLYTDDLWIGENSVQLTTLSLLQEKTGFFDFSGNFIYYP